MTGCFQKKNVEMGELTMLTKICLSYSVLDVEIAPKWLNLKKMKNIYTILETFLSLLKMQYQNPLTYLPLVRTIFFLLLVGIYRITLLTGHIVTIKCVV